jgi:predicted nucleotidyltransferase
MDETNFELARSKLSGKDRQQLDRLLALVRDVLGPEVVGAYLFGSAVLGGREESDLDVLVVSRRPTTDEEKRLLSTRLLSISGRRTGQVSWRRLELTIVVESYIKPWRFPPRVDFLYGDWLRSEFERGNLKPWRSRANYDLVSLLTMVLLSDTPLIGPAPWTVFGPIPHEHLVRAMVEDIPTLLDDLDSDTSNVKGLKRFRRRSPITSSTAVRIQRAGSGKACLLRPATILEV